jgi:hypothetical protein
MFPCKLNYDYQSSSSFWNDSHLNELTFLWQILGNFDNLCATLRFYNYYHKTSNLITVLTIIFLYISTNVTQPTASTAHSSCGLFTSSQLFFNHSIQILNTAVPNFLNITKISLISGDFAFSLLTLVTMHYFTKPDM